MALRMSARILKRKFNIGILSNWEITKVCIVQQRQNVYYFKDADEPTNSEPMKTNLLIAKTRRECWSLKCPALYEDPPYNPGKNSLTAVNWSEVLLSFNSIARPCPACNNNALNSITL
ncbi:hypothetical protein TNCV_4652021 [Trichonephila clavipes]|nr:hypothetical protein TNCV_4652021 [Trichonephila clavipes]